MRRRVGPAAAPAGTHTTVGHAWASWTRDLVVASAPSWPTSHPAHGPLVQIGNADPIWIVRALEQSHLQLL